MAGSWLLFILRLGQITDRDIFPIFTERPLGDFEKIKNMQHLVSIDKPVGEGDSRGLQVETLADNIPAVEASVESQVIGKLDDERVYAFLREILKPKELQALILRFVFDLKLKQIQDLMNLNNHQHASLLAENGRKKTLSNSRARSVFGLKKT